MALSDFLRLFRGPEKRDDNPAMTIDQWGKLYHDWSAQFNNPLVGYGPPVGKSEDIPNDFIGYVNGAYKQSGVVFAVAYARALIFSEIRFIFQGFDPDSGRPDKLFDDPTLRLLDHPWPNGTTGDLLARALQDVDLCGNTYWVREDKVPGKPRLRRLRPDWVHIVLTKDPKQALDSDIAGYVYKPDNTENVSKWEIYPIDGSNGAVAHWAPIPDPEAQYRGMSWLTPVVREIKADKAIGEHKNRFFENAAVPNLVVSLPETVSKEDFKDFVEVMNGKTGVRHAYENLFLGGGADVTVVGSNIQQMDFKSVGGTVETRIAAAGRVHPALVGLSEGLQGSSLNEGNFQAAKDLMVEGFLRPSWRSLCAAFAVLVDEKPTARLWYDDRDISFLREDRKKVADRQLVESQTIDGYVMNGFTPESAVLAVLHDDISLLKHTGLFSVQLLPPNISHPEQWGDKNKNGVPDAEEGQTGSGTGKSTSGTGKSQGGGSGKPKTGSGTSGANNNPTGSKRKPVGRPPAKGKT